MHATTKTERWGLVVAAMACAAPLLTTTRCPAAPPTPLALKPGLSPLVIEADDRLDLGITGSVDFWFAATSDATDRSAHAGLLAHADASRINYKIFMAGDRQSVGLDNGQESASVPFDFSDGKYHHVAVITRGRFTQVIIDGKSQGFIPLGYSGEKGLDFYIGDVDGPMPGFVGYMLAARIWKSGLALEDVRALRLPVTYGVPQQFRPAFHSLVGYSEFADEDQALFFTEPDWEHSPHVGHANGEQDDHLIRELHRLAKIEVTTAADRIVDVQMLYETPDGRLIGEHEARAEEWMLEHLEAVQAANQAVRDSQERTGRALKRLHDWLGRWPFCLELWSERLQSEALRGELAAAEPNFQRLTAIRKEYTSNKSALKRARFAAVEASLAELLTILDARAELLEESAPRAPAKAEGTVHSFQFAAGESLAGMAGYRNAASLMTVRLITNRRLSPIFGRRSDESESEPYLLWLEPWEKTTGIRRWVGDDGKLAGAAFRFVSDSESEALGAPVSWDLQDNFLPDSVDLGRYVEAQHLEPVRDDRLARSMGHVDQRDGFVHLHGNYTSYPVYKLMVVGDGQELILVEDHYAELPPSADNQASERPCDGPDATAPVDREHTLRLRRFSASDLSRGRYREVGGEGKLILLPSGQFTYNGRRYRSPTPYDTSANPDAEGISDKLPWGATFSSDQRPQLAEFNVRGYHVARLNPHNIQLTTGTSARLFQWPSENSYDYQTTTAGKIVPYGLYYRPDRQAAEHARTEFVSSARGHQEAWKTTLGFNIKGPGDAAYTDSSSYRSELGATANFESGVARRFEREHVHTVSSTTEVQYALVLDRSRVAASEEFVAAVEDLRDQYLIGGDPDFKTFVDGFGTHYPYAVTYGGMAFLEMTYSKRAQMDLLSKGRTFGGHASGTLEGVTVSFQASHSHSWSEELAEVMSQQEQRVRTVGGSISRGGGWSLPHNEEVPLLLDLRPIDELLGPMFFGDKLIWTDVRRGLRQYLDALPKGNLQDVQRPRYYEVSVTQLRRTSPEQITDDILFGLNPLAFLIYNIANGFSDPSSKFSGEVNIDPTGASDVANSVGELEADRLVWALKEGDHELKPEAIFPFGKAMGTRFFYVLPEKAGGSGFRISGDINGAAFNSDEIKWKDATFQPQERHIIVRGSSGVTEFWHVSIDYTFREICPMTPF